MRKQKQKDLSVKKLRRNRRWCEQEVIVEIKKWHALQKPLYSHYIRLNYQELLAAGIRYYGSWKNAVLAAGVDYEDIRRYHEWSKDYLIKRIKELHAEGRDLSFRAMMQSPYQSMVYAAIRPKHFGSWKKALEAAEIKPSTVYRYKSWSEEEIIEEIRALHRAGKDLSSKAMDATSNSLIATARRKFGSWAQALQIAGINYDSIR